MFKAIKISPWNGSERSEQFSIYNPPMSTPENAIESGNDFGLGQKVAEASRRRLLNQDGSFNVAKRGIPFYRSLSLYHSLLFMPWWKFYVCLLIAYFVCNLAFAIQSGSCSQGHLPPVFSPL